MPENQPIYPPPPSRESSAEKLDRALEESARATRRLAEFTRLPNRRAENAETRRSRRELSVDPDGL